MKKINKETILIVDGLRTNALALKKMLEAEWSVEIALDGPSALEAAAKDPAPGLILLDVRMPGMDGHETCRRLKQNEGTKPIPVIFITALGGSSDEELGLELGAVDYITKPVHGPTMRARIRNHLALQKALGELELKNRELERLATRDKLTGLYNRRKLDDALAREVIRAERYGRPLSVILFDLDHFKKVNDTHGHPTGDAVLAETATRLAKVLRTSDIAGRWGGEEFMIICPETGAETARVLTERLRAGYAEHAFAGVGRLTASFGVTSHRQGLNPKDILAHVDDALYRAKHNGRNRVEQEKGETS